MNCGSASMASQKSKIERIVDIIKSLEKED